MKRTGFTLIEILLVVAIIGILAGLLFSGIFGVQKASVNARNADNRKVLEAAIMEYYHDNHKWPVGDDKPVKLKTGEVTVEGDTAGEQTRDAYSFGLEYGGLKKTGGKWVLKGKNNSHVVDILLNAQQNGKPHPYLDLATFTTTWVGNETEWPQSETAPALGVHEGTIKEPGVARRKNGKNIPLVYMADFVECPHCQSLYAATDDRKTCNSKDCSYYKKNKSFYRFSPSEKKATVKCAMPYVIRIDYLNNKCTVGLN